MLNNLRNAFRRQRQEPAPAADVAPFVEPPIAIEDPWTVEPPNAPLPEDAEAFVKSYSFWYHRVYLGNGVYTLPPTLADHVWARIKPAFPEDLQGASMLDVGCNTGFFSILAKLRGAGRIVGIEFLKMFFDQAEAIRKIWGMDIEYRLTDAHEISRMDEQFDLVMFTGILYHLKHPLYVLEDVSRRCRDAVIVETEVIPEHPRNVLMARMGPLDHIKLTATTKGFMKFYERDELNGDVSNWWVPDTECLLGMLRVAGFNYFSRPIYYAPSRVLLIATKNEQSLLDPQKI
jgi:tRNA (mo5U34)-methyltransferase